MSEDRIEIRKVAFEGPKGTAVMRYWHRSSYYVDLETPFGEQYIGSSTDMATAESIACRAAGLPPPPRLVRGATQQGETM